MEPVARLNVALEGRYVIDREIGAGAMATVYGADDIKHGRRVALKVLKPSLAAFLGADRFLSEIRTTANLHHPHILPLFDSGTAGELLFFAMPFVEGETLRSRIDRERQLPVEDAVHIATQLAEALDYAHRHGIVHRDVKPANVLLHDGKAMLADFGIALAFGAMDADVRTQTGMSMGTPHYMSAEQAVGDGTVGPSSDLYALGCVLYEMLVGEPPHTGSTVPAILAQVFSGDVPSPRVKRRSTPPHVDAAVRKALEKLPADRFKTCGDFARALTDPSFRHGFELVGATTRSERLWQAAAVALAVVTVVSFVANGGTGPTGDEAPAVSRFATPFADGQEPRFGELGAFSMAPDGSFLVYRGAQDQSGTTQLWVRRWRDLEASRLLPEGQERAGWPTVSPDGTEVAFSVGPNECADAQATTTANSVATRADPCRIVVAGIGAFRTRELTGGSSPFWATDGNVYASVPEGTVRVPSSGGEPQPVTLLRDGDIGHVIGDFVEESGRVLLYAGVLGSDPEIRSADPETGEMTMLAIGEAPRYLPPGYLVFLAPDRSLTVATFDPERMVIEGPQVPLVANVTSYTLSDDGKLFYSVGSAGGAFEFVWVDRFGRVEQVDPGWVFSPGSGNYAWSLSPDGSRLAVREATDAGLDIWIKELDDGPRVRLTLDGAQDWGPRWVSNDTVLFLSNRAGDRDVYAQRADGTGEARLIWDDDRRIAEAHVSPDGKWLVVRSGEASSAAGTRDIYVIEIGDTVARPVLAQPYDEASPNLSPDGRWLAYVSNESGRYEVFVRSFPNVEAVKVQVSIDGGWMPMWAHSGRELFFVDEEMMMTAADLDASRGFRVVGRRRLFEIPQGAPRPATGVLHWVDPSDQRFLMARPARESGWSFVLVQNFPEEVGRLAN